MNKEEKTPRKNNFVLQLFSGDYVPYEMKAVNVYFTKNDNILYVEINESEGRNFYLNLNSRFLERIIPIDNAKIGYLE